MTDLRKAAEKVLRENKPHGEFLEALDELRQALAQPEQEQYVTKVVAMHEDGTYTTERIALPKRKWVGLTDEEIKEIIGPWGDTPIKGYTRKLFDQIEAKLKEKNGG